MVATQEVLVRLCCNNRHELLLFVVLHGTKHSLLLQRVVCQLCVSRNTLCCPTACGLSLLQIVMGRSIPEQQLQHLGGLFSSLTAGLVAWPYIDVPFTPWHK